MKLYVKCDNCSHENALPYRAFNRMKLEKRYGDSIEVNCSACDDTQNYHLNSIKAKMDRRPILIGIAALALVFSVYWIIQYLPISRTNWIDIFIVMALIAVPVVVYRKTKNREKQNVLRFNHYKLKIRKAV